jgi:hypothetical protein
MFVLKQLFFANKATTAYISIAPTSNGADIIIRQPLQNYSHCLLFTECSNEIRRFQIAAWKNCDWKLTVLYEFFFVFLSLSGQIPWNYTEMGHGSFYKFILY